MTKREQAKPGDEQWTTNKQRCWQLLADWSRGEHHMGKVTHCGRGLRMTRLGEVATFDGDDMTRLVLFAHQRRCRVAVSPAGPWRLSIEVHPRKPAGSLYERHPGLSDLEEQCRRLSQ